MSPPKKKATGPFVVIEGTDPLKMAEFVRQIIEEASKSGDRDKIKLIVSEHGLLTLHADLIQLARDGKPSQRIKEK